MQECEAVGIAHLEDLIRKDHPVELHARLATLLVAELHKRVCAPAAQLHTTAPTDRRSEKAMEGGRCGDVAMWRGHGMWRCGEGMEEGRCVEPPHLDVENRGSQGGVVALTLGEHLPKDLLDERLIETVEREASGGEEGRRTAGGWPMR